MFSTGSFLVHQIQYLGLRSFQAYCNYINHVFHPKYFFGKLLMTANYLKSFNMWTLFVEFEYSP